MLHLRNYQLRHLQKRVRNFSSLSYNDIISGKYDVSKAFPITDQEKALVRKLHDGLVKQDRATLARAITLVESTHRRKKLLGQILLQYVITDLSTSKSNTLRIGLSGPPGAGKSTFIETFGTYLTEHHDLKVAVLAVDPSSNRTGGSLLGDKTRMTYLSRNPKAYIRPSPAQGTLGGVTRTTTEAMMLCETAGYDVVIVETVGVGQSEVAVSDMTDIFLLLIPPASGDELQGIKRGIVELVDMVIINKADGDLLPAARRLQAEYTSAMKFVPRKHTLWKQKVRRVSSISGDGISDLWSMIKDFYELMSSSAELTKLRKEQRAIWMWNHIRESVLEVFASNSNVARALPVLEGRVKNCEITPGLACDLLLSNYFKSSKIL